MIDGIKYQDACFCFKIFTPDTVNHISIHIFFMNIDKEIGFHQYPEIGSIDLIVGMMIADQVADPLTQFRLCMQAFKYPSGNGGAFHFLVPANAGMMLFHSLRNANVMQNSCYFSYPGFFLAKQFGLAYYPGKTVNL